MDMLDVRILFAMTMTLLELTDEWKTMQKDYGLSLTDEEFNSAERNADEVIKTIKNTVEYVLSILPVHRKTIKIKLFGDYTIDENYCKLVKRKGIPENI